MATTTVITITVNGDADLEDTVKEVAALVARNSGLPTEAIVEKAKHLGPFWVARVIHEVAA